MGALLLSGEGTKARLAIIAGVVLLRTLLQDRIARLNGRSVEHVLKQDRTAFVRLIGLSVLQVPAPSPPTPPPPGEGTPSGKPLPNPLV